MFVAQHPEQRIADMAALELLFIILQLLDQDGHEIHHRLRLRMLLQMKGHVGVILHGVQIRPGQHIFAGADIRGNPAGACASTG